MKKSSIVLSRVFNTTTLVGSLAALLFLGAGCNKSPSASAPPATTSGDEILIKGSNTIGEELAPRLAAEFKKDHSQSKISIETRGSASGFWGLIAGVCDIAASSRTPLKDELQQAEVRGIQFTDNLVGFYSVGVILNANNPVTNLSKAQVRDIFTGAIQNWKDLGGPDTPIHCYVRDPISGTYLGFREIAMEDKAYTTNNLTELKSYGAIAMSVAKDPAGIGYAGLNVASNPGIKVASIDGTTASADAVKQNKYAFARGLHLFTNKDKQGTAAKAFIDFVQSAKGQAILAELGYVPKP